jgi:hypothetical protein
MLDDQGSNASILFVGLDLRRCSTAQIRELQSRNSFQWSVVADSLPSTLVSLISTVENYKQLFESEHSELQQFRSEHREMKQICDRQSQVIEDLIARVARLEVGPSFLSFPLKVGPPPDGIVAYLIRKHGGNPATLGFVKVDLSSVYDNGRLGSNLFDFMTPSDACAGKTSDTSQWIDFDFQAMHVIPTHYWIRSYNSGPNGAHLKSWVLQCIDNQERPVELDSRVDTTVLNSAHAIETFNVAHPMECRVLRLKSTSPTHWAGNWRVIISGFELFGLLRE